MKAVENDSEGKLVLAIKFYTQALEYFIPALACKFLTMFSGFLSDYCSSDTLSI